MPRRVLLVLDQLEEVFGTAEGSEARALLKLLLVAATSDGSSLVVLATMRLDFLNLFQLFPGVQENYQGIPLDPMPSERFAEVIDGPAKRSGLDLGQGLSERLATDTSFNGALPLLAHTLEKLYERCRDSGQLTVEVYESLFPAVTMVEGGKAVEYRGVAASIEHRADDILRHAGYVLSGQIESEATERKWPWPEDRVIDAVGEIGPSGVSLEDAEHPEVMRAFLGPTGRGALDQLPALGAFVPHLSGPLHGAALSGAVPGAPRSRQSRPLSEMLADHGLRAEA
ncbi:hypothetical protein [Accumulibacter sp.]|uniref:nSTAND1 domain-containing NTPase n=1 Tax=Accumulibacter sp. TaxID=2053492 RepID=UPI0038577DE8